MSKVTASCTFRQQQLLFIDVNINFHDKRVAGELQRAQEWPGPFPALRRQRIHRAQGYCRSLHEYIHEAIFMSGPSAP